MTTKRTKYRKKSYRTRQDGDREKDRGKHSPPCKPDKDSRGSKTMKESLTSATDDSWTATENLETSREIEN